MCGMPTIQYSARSIRLSVCKLFTYCIRQGLVSRDSMVMVIGCLQLSDVSVICHVVNPCQTSQKIWEASCTECTGQENDFGLTPTVKLETILPQRDHLVENFRWSVIIAELWWPKVTRCWYFFGKTALMVKFSKFCSECFHCNTDPRVVFKFCEIWLKGNHALLNGQKENKTSPGSPAVRVATAWIAPKICQGKPPTMFSECSRFDPNRFTNAWTPPKCALKWIQYSVEA